MNSLYFEDFNIGDEFVSSTRTFTETDLVLFGGMTGDFNLVHTDEEFAKKTMYGTRVSYGLLGLSLGMGLLQRLGILESTGMAYLEVTNWKFKGVIKIGDTIHSVSRVVDKKETSKPDRGVINIEMSVMNHHGEEVQRGNHIMMVARKQVSSQ